MIIQLCGLSGSGKTTLASQVKQALNEREIYAEVIDADVFRTTFCADLGFSRADRNENIRRLAFIAADMARHQIIPIICAINPYEDIRLEVAALYPDVKTVYVDCGLDILVQRDSKKLYHRALLPEGHPEKISNLTGVNDPFEVPRHPDLVIKTDTEPIEASVNKLLEFIVKEYSDTTIAPASGTLV